MNKSPAVILQLAQLHKLVQDELLGERHVVKVSSPGLLVPDEADDDRPADLRKIQEIPADVALGALFHLRARVRARPALPDVLIQPRELQRDESLVDHLSAFRMPSIAARTASPTGRPAINRTSAAIICWIQFRLSKFRIFIMFVNLLDDDVDLFRIRVRILC